ncbi:hypothetical protein PENTCL1PPCAC_13537, partial [Pristionchus entomophagus]
LFNQYPPLKDHFVGAEEFMGQDPKEPTKFAKQGQRLLMAIHSIADAFDDSEVFEARVTDVVRRHWKHNVAPALWGVRIKLETTGFDSKQHLTMTFEDSWRQLGLRFNKVAQSTLQRMGLPFEK